MNPSTWQMAKQIFEEAREIAAADRQAFLGRRCAGDAELRGEVEKLLGFYDSDFLEETALDAAEALVKPALETGQIIGRYRIGKLIGSGGMGQVFRAEDTELGRPVAFKVLHHDVGADDERLRRFVQEARAASALNHPNILTIHEIGSFEGFRFIVSEFVDGETLRDRMRRGLNIEESVEITCQIAAALKAAHSAGIVHRDIKPENVMLRGDSLVKVLDFGLAKLTEADDQPIDPKAPPSAVHTSPGLVMGTAAYMSPEQARGQAVDARTDIWSLGVVFHEMLTGASPFACETVTQLIASILKTDSSDALAANLPPELHPICRKALAKEKDSRYRSAHDLLKDLEGEKKRMEYATQPSRYISISTTDELRTQIIRPKPTLSAEFIYAEVRQHKLITGFIALLAFAGIGMAVYNFNGASISSSGQILGFGPSTTEQDMETLRLPFSGAVSELAISPDGNHIAYIVANGNSNAVRIFDRASASDSEILPKPAAGSYQDVSFGPDGKNVYFLLNTPNNEEIFRISISGGSAVKIANDTDGGGTISHDGKWIAFNREVNENRDGESLIIANADGTNERVLVHTKADEPWIYCGGKPAWSHDGKKIACWIEQGQQFQRVAKLVAVNTDDGTQSALSDREWGNINSAAWTPEGNLLVSGQIRSTESQNPPDQIWLVVPGNQPRALTTGLASYGDISITRKGDLLVTRQGETRRDLWILPGNDVAKGRQVTTTGEIAAGLTWTADGRVLISGRISGSPQIWLMNPDGSGRRQITREGINQQPRVTADGRYVVFRSDRSDKVFHIFRMDLDGNNVKQLTTGSQQQQHPTVSSDGKWVYYIQFETGSVSVKKVPIDGGEPSVITTLKGIFLVSLDASPKDNTLAVMQNRRVNGANSSERKVLIISATDGKVLRTLDLPTSARLGYVRWTRDGKSIGYHDDRDKSGEIWTFPANGVGKPTQVTNFRTPMTLNYDWSFDGKQMAVSRGVNSNDPVLIRNRTN